MYLTRTIAILAEELDEANARIAALEKAAAHPRPPEMKFGGAPKETLADHPGNLPKGPLDGMRLRLGD